MINALLLRIETTKKNHGGINMLGTKKSASHLNKEQVRLFLTRLMFMDLESTRRKKIVYGAGTY